MQKGRTEVLPFFMLVVLSDYGLRLGMRWWCCRITLR